MVDNSQLAESKSIHRRTGKTFYYATRLLPQRVRRATYVLYAFFRISDEVVDSAGQSPAGGRTQSGDDTDFTPKQQRERLLSIRDQALGREPTDEPVLAAFDELRREVGIEDEEVEVFIDAMLTDIEKTRYETYDELEAYMRGSASAVGEMMTSVMGPEDPATARPHAQKLGEAFQLTNFLRDVREDIVERGRIYLPQTTLAEYGVTDEQLERFEVDEAFRDVMRHELRRAEGLYREGVAGIETLPEDCQFPVLLASVLYADHHRLIRERNYDVLSATPQLSTLRKLTLVAKTGALWSLSKDPERVFARVSAIPMGSDHRHGRPDHEAGEARPAQ
ncbi:phytoene/squalene synthase family protein [Halomarina litorea]|uniref:phytoene/squalene synthase family protein n=1 Tax=Halomarina litorea TaxID=2961595 RepID=UPI0020C3C748|nr:phytoene/squalene synthase family protein [Halomarina sp. BCD28]